MADINARTGNHSTQRIGSTVSRRLRAAGFNVSPAARRYRFDGLFVTARGSRVEILIDLGLDSKNERVSTQLVTEIIGWDQVGDFSVDITTNADGGHAFVRFDYEV